MLRGSFTALVTPFTRDGGLDEKAFRALVEWQIAEGTKGLVPVGTTGESPTLSHDEHRQVVEACVEVSKGRVPVVAGAGSNNTQEAVGLVQHAEKVGADAVLVVTPYYNKPTQEGMYQHFKAIAEAVDCPMVLYNVPGRTVADMQVETALRLAQVPGIVAIKEASGNIERAAWLIKKAPAGFSIYSGDDPTAVAMMLLGGHGNISVTANIAPRAMHELCVAAIAGDARRAAEIHLQLLPLHKELFCEPNPVPVKWALGRLNRCGSTLRLPLTPLSPAGQAAVEQALRASGLL